MVYTSLRILTIANCRLVKTQGSGNVILNYVNGLKERGHRFKVYSVESYSSLNYLKGRAFIYRFAFLSFLTIINELYIRKNKYDVIEFYGEENWLSILFLKKIAKNHIFLHHSNGPSTIVDSWLKSNKKSDKISYFLKKASITNAKMVVLVSKYCYNHVVKDLNVATERVCYIDNGLETGYLGLNIDYSKKDNILLFIGSFIPIKGRVEFIDTLNSVFKKKLDWKAEIIGDNDEKDIELFDQSIRHRITFKKIISNKEELSSIYSRSKVLFMPSVVETFGLAFCEAMAHKCVVVSRDVGFLQECNSKEVLKCTNDFDEVLNALLINDNKIQEIAENGYKKVQQLVWSRSIDRYEDILKKLVANFTND